VKRVESLLSTQSLSKLSKLMSESEGESWNDKERRREKVSDQPMNTKMENKTSWEREGSDSNVDELNGKRKKKWERLRRRWKTK
jgi:hypothetical protein